MSDVSMTILEECPIPWASLAANDRRVLERAKNRLEELLQEEEWETVTMSVLAKNLGLKRQYWEVGQGMTRVHMWVLFLYKKREKEEAAGVSKAWPFPALSDFLGEYPEYRSREEEELKKLFLFANWVKLAVGHMGGKNNKTSILKIGAKLAEGPEAAYVTGSGQSQMTSDRVDLIEKLGGLSHNSRNRDATLQMEAALWHMADKKASHDRVPVPRMENGELTFVNDPRYTSSSPASFMENLVQPTRLASGKRTGRKPSKPRDSAESGKHTSSREHYEGKEEEYRVPPPPLPSLNTRSSSSGSLPQFGEFGEMLANSIPFEQLPTHSLTPALPCPRPDLLRQGSCEMEFTMPMPGDESEPFFEVDRGMPYMVPPVPDASSNARSSSSSSKKVNYRPDLPPSMNQY